MTASGDLPPELAARDERRARYRAGLRSEWLAGTVLRLNGYRILDKRWRCAGGEVDIIAVRGRRLVFVEVKRRRSLDDEEAHAAVGPGQRTRIVRAADIWLARNPRYRNHDIGFDLMLVAPWRWPRRIENGL